MSSLNPFIESMPPRLSGRELLEILSEYPDFSEAERNLEKEVRIDRINTLFNFYQPLPVILELERRVRVAITESYRRRNPVQKDASSVYWRLDEGKGRSISSSFTQWGFCLIGISGVGKTVAVEKVLNLYPQVVQIKTPAMDQVLWVKVECPHDGSLKALLLEFFIQVDQLVGSTHYDRMTKSKATLDTMLIAVRKVAQNIGLGLFVVDEIQHLNLSKNGGAEKMLNFFTNLINMVGVPVILVGTPQILKILQGDFRLARRSLSPYGDLIWNRIEQGPVWDLLVAAMWEYQWTKKTAELTAEMVQTLHDETQGITDILKKVFAMAQILAIENGKEKLSVEIIRQVCRERLTMIQPMLAALKSADAKRISRFSDLYIPGDFFTGKSEGRRQTVRFVPITESSNLINALNLKPTNRMPNSDSVLDEDGQDIRESLNDSALKGEDAYSLLKKRGLIKPQLFGGI